MFERIHIDRLTNLLPRMSCCTSQALQRLNTGEVFKEEGDVDSSFDDSFDLDQSVTPPYPDGGTPPDVSPRLAPLDADRHNVLNMSAGVPTEWSL